MKYSVKNTITTDAPEIFDTMKQVEDHIQTELAWYNEHEKKSPYTKDDFNVADLMTTKEVLEIHEAIMTAKVEIKELGFKPVISANINDEEFIVLMRRQDGFEIDYYPQNSEIIANEADIETWKAAVMSFKSEFDEITFIERLTDEA